MAWLAEESESDYDLDTGPGPFDAAVYEPPWLERDAWGDALASYLPASPRTLEPCHRIARARAEFGRTMGGGGFWDYETEARARAMTTNLRGQADDALLRRRMGQARARIDAGRMLAWMRIHAAELGERARQVFELYYLRGRRAAACALELGITTHGVVAAVSKLRVVVGLAPLADAAAPPRRGRRTTLSVPTGTLRRPLAAPRIQLVGSHLVAL